MSMHRQVVLDTETTGLSWQEGHRVIEIGCLEMINRRLTGKNFHVYLNPERDIERSAEKIHGMTRAFLSDKPKFCDIADSFVQFIRDAELVIHNAPFDVGFVNNEFVLADYSQKIDQLCQIVDTLAIARRQYPGQQNSLDALCRRYTIDRSHRTLHGALLDAELLAQVYLLLTGGQDQLFKETVSREGATDAVETARCAARDMPRTSVIYANTNELQAHDEFMRKMQCADLSD